MNNENELTVLRANIAIETLTKYNDGRWEDLYNVELSLEQSMYEYLEMLKDDNLNPLIIDIVRTEVFNIKITLEEIHRMLNSSVYLLEDAFINLRIRKTDAICELLKNNEVNYEQTFTGENRFDVS